MMKSLLRVIPLVALVAFADTVQSQEKGDAALLQGKWTVTKMIKRGKGMDADRFEGMTFTFAKNQVSIVDKPGLEQRNYKFKVDDAKKPKHIDFTPEDGRLKGQTAPGLYQLDKDALVLCLPHDKNTERPDALESKGGGAPSRIVFYLKRVME